MSARSLVVTLAAIILTTACGDPDDGATRDGPPPRDGNAERELAARTVEAVKTVKLVPRKNEPGPTGLVRLADIGTHDVDPAAYASDPVWVENDARLKAIAREILQALRTDDIESIEYLCASPEGAAAIARRHGVEIPPPQYLDALPKMFRSRFEEIRDRTDWSAAEIVDVTTEVCRKTRIGPMLRASAIVRMRAGEETFGLVVDDFFLTPDGWRAGDRTWLLYR